MLKNTVPAPEYVLMSEPVYQLSDSELRERSVRIEQELEGLGTMPSYFVDLDELALELPHVPEPTFFDRLQETVGVATRSFPRAVGLRKLRAPDRSEAT